MNGKLLLDTNAAIAFMAGNASVVALVTSASNAIPVIVAGELYYGAYNSDRPQQNLLAIETLLASTTIIDCDMETGRLFGQIKAKLRTHGKPIPDNDLWIAALAIQYSLTLLTRDAHFQNVSRVSTVTW